MFDKVTSLLLLCAAPGSGELIASIILPHGDFALAPSLLPENSEERQAADEVSTAAKAAGSWLSRTIQPDILVVSTPHGMELTHDFAFYLGSTASGYADIGQDLHNGTRHHYDLDRILLQPNATHHLIDHLHDQSVSGILNFADSEDMNLRWGEVIPLLLVGKQPKSRHHMILSHPLRRYSQSPSMVPELLTLGQSFRRWADGRPERIALLISSDLSHTHRADGPYGYSNASAPFDAAVKRWASDPNKNADSLLTEATSLQDRAMSCGFTGMVMLHGCLMSGGFEPQVMAMRNATYYGMMVATFAKIEEQLTMEDSMLERDIIVSSV